MIKLKGIKQKEQWAAFSLDGKILLYTIADREYLSKFLLEKKMQLPWSKLAQIGHTTNKILLDIKLL